MERESCSKRGGWYRLCYKNERFETSISDKVDLYEKWEQSYRLRVMFIKTKISAGICSSVNQYNTVKELLNTTYEQFEPTDKALANTMIMSFSTLTLIIVKGMHEHIM